MENPEVVYDNKAYTITTLFNVRGEILGLHAHRPNCKPLVPAGGSSIEYRMTQIGIFAKDHSLDVFRQRSRRFSKCSGVSNEKERRVYSRCKC